MAWSWAATGSEAIPSEPWLPPGETCPVPCRVLDPFDDCPCWTGRVDALLLWRDQPQSAAFFDSIAGPSPRTALGAADLGSGMAAGPRFTIFRHTGDTGAIEFNYFRVQDFTSSRPAGEGGGPYAFSDGVLCCSPFGVFVDASAVMSSELQSFELNRRMPTDGRLQWLAGFRWLQWNESLGLQADGFPLPPPLPLQQIAIDTRTNNDLYGMQVGADSILWGAGGPFWIEGIGKAGVYYNRSAQFTSYSNTFPAEVVAGGTGTSRAAFVGELGLTGVWQVNHCLAIRAGWVAFWLGGLALAPNQLDRQCLICEDRPVRQATDTGGSVFHNGLSLGLEGRW